MSLDPYVIAPIGCGMTKAIAHWLFEEQEIDTGPAVIEATGTPLAARH